MKKITLYLIPILSVLWSCDYIPKEDQHPEVPFFHDIIKDRTVFEKVIELSSESEDIYLLNTNKYLHISYSTKKANQEKPIKADEKAMLNDDRLIYKIEIRDFDNKVYLHKEIESHRFAQEFSIIFDKKGNLFLKGNQYFAPDYQKSKNLEEINIEDTLFAYNPKEDNGIIEDSLRKEYKKSLEKRYDFKWKEDTDYIVRDTQILILNNHDLVNDAEPKKTYFDTFDESILVEYRNDNRAFPSSYYYDYYKYGKLKFKYADGTSGMRPPEKIGSNGKTYLFHPEYGLYRIIKY